MLQVRRDLSSYLIRSRWIRRILLQLFEDADNPIQSLEVLAFSCVNRRVYLQDQIIPIHNYRFLERYNNGSYWSGLKRPSMDFDEPGCRGKVALCRLDAVGSIRKVRQIQGQLI